MLQQLSLPDGHRVSHVIERSRHSNEVAVFNKESQIVSVLHKISSEDQLHVTGFPPESGCLSAHESVGFGPLGSCSGKVGDFTADAPSVGAAWLDRERETGLWVGVLR